MRWSATVLTLALATGLVPAEAPAAECAAPKAVVTTAVGMKFCSDPTFDSAIASLVQRARQVVRAQRRAGKQRLEKEYGDAVWVLDPGRYQLADVGGRSPGGADYMVMWTAVLAAEDGMGRDFDMVHFTGPHDMRAFFGCVRDDITGCIDSWLTARAGSNERLRSSIATDPARRQAFLRYYAMRASSAYSSGAHDEWNIFVRINLWRPLGEQVAVFFDGRPASPAEMETEVAPGYELR
jgi:hypothetical protein